MEKKKLLLVVVSVGVFLLIVVGASLVVFTAKKPSPVVLSSKPTVIAPGTAGSNGGGSTPSSGTAGEIAGSTNGGTTGANSGNTEPGVSAQGTNASGTERVPASVDASEWVRNPKSVPGLQAPAPGSSSTRGDVIIIYGDKGAQVAPTISSGGTGRPETGTVIEVPKPATPTVPEPVSPSAPAATPSASVGPTSKDGTGAVTQTTKRTLTMESTTTTVKGSASTSASTASKSPVAKAEPAKPTAQKVYDDYWIQTGAFSTKNLADSAREALSRKGIPSFVEIKTLNDKTYYRVRVGPYTSKKEADYWLSLVKALDGFDKSYVTMVKNRR